MDLIMTFTGVLRYKERTSSKGLAQSKHIVDSKRMALINAVFMPRPCHHPVTECVPRE